MTPITLRKELRDKIAEVLHRGALWSKDKLAEAIADAVLEVSGIAKRTDEISAEYIIKPEREKDLVDGILKYSLPTVTLKSAVTTCFPFNVNWETKQAREWLEWAHGENVTPEQIKQAAETWRSDKAFNWQQPTLKLIFEKWPALMAESGQLSNARPEPEVDDKGIVKSW